MVKFLDGPAKDQVLRLGRSPVLLRVVQSPGDRWDALDQLTDVARDNEKIFVYRLTAQPSSVHICRRPGGGGWDMMAEYAVVEPQPSDAILRSNRKWGEWADAHAAEYLEMIQ